MNGVDKSGYAPNPQAGFAPEWNLLLTACSAAPASEKIARIRALTQSPIRWNDLFKITDRQGVTSLLHQALSRAPEVLPADAMRELDQRRQANLLKALLTARELVRILDCLDSLAIETVSYKGLALAETLYGDMAARQSGDLDLLVHTADLPRITEAVGGLGYMPHLALAGKQREAYLFSGYECAFDGPAGKNLLELQWAMQPRFYAVDFDVEGLFRRAVLVTVAGREMKTPSPEDLVLVLSAHAAKHMWTRLIWLCDIARLMQLPGINWDWIQLQSRALGIARILQVTLLLSQRLLQVAMPASIARDSLEDRAAQIWAQSIGEQMAEGIAPDVESWKYFRAMMRLRERPGDQIRFLWRLVSTPGPAEWESVRLPAPLFPLYRLVRLSRLAARLSRATASRYASLALTQIA